MTKGGSQHRTWKPAELEKARELKGGGLSYEEIGNALGRSGRAVLDSLRRHSPENVAERTLSYWDGPPIERCRTAEHLRNNAIKGSARLRAEIERVFGQQRIAA